MAPVEDQTPLSLVTSFQTPTAHTVLTVTTTMAIAAVTTIRRMTGVTQAMIARVGEEIDQIGDITMTEETDGIIEMIEEEQGVELIIDIQETIDGMRMSLRGECLM